jgi:N4-(beta-N-acetylglucosaminyl)-L-asparaginase
MKTNRRHFLKTAAIGSVLLNACKGETKEKTITKAQPTIVSTWNFGVEANAAAWDALAKGGTALDAVEAGGRVPEADPSNQSVGYGGLPDRDGRVTLDACIMDAQGNAGSVCGLEHIMHPISVARMVMEKTPHVILVGEGALEFALKNGFKKENLLTESSKKAWQEWLKKGEYKPIINVENHDTIGILALDGNQNLSGGCTTSGLAYKMHGRVGDSPIIGAGLYVDNEIGAATSTGLGELVIRTCGSFLIVELMRQGLSPQKACEEGVKRVMSKNKNFKDVQVGFLAINKQGEIGAYALQKGFQYAVNIAGKSQLLDADYFLK